MDFVEQATEHFLRGLDLGAVVHEPCGRSKFPDFSVDDRIGVECTRLVTRVDKDGLQYNATEIEPRIVQSLEKAIESVKFGHLTASHFVCFDYRININLHDACKKLRTYLESLSRSYLIFPHSYTIDDTLSVQLLQSTTTFATPFVLGGFMNLDAGGWVLDQLIRQTKEAISRKSKKSTNRPPQFDEWWLSVSSSLTVGVSDEYISFLLDELSVTGLWQRLLLVNPFDPERSRIIALWQA